ncbi:hypothetical protein GW17_00003779 [Ensete ventricosum]|nr:hypothetical protein GW17_00003779 [Ensete ventricosum]
MHTAPLRSSLETINWTSHSQTSLPAQKSPPLPPRHPRSTNHSTSTTLIPNKICRIGTAPCVLLPVASPRWRRPFCLLRFLNRAYPIATVHNVDKLSQYAVAYINHLSSLVFASL